MKSISLYLIFFILTLWGAQELRLPYNRAQFKEYTDILLDVSSMVFTLMGIWIALIYPNAIQRIADPTRIKTADFSESLTETRRLESLVASVIKAASIVFLIVLFWLIELLLTGSDFAAAHNAILKHSALAFIVVLTFVQLESILYVVFSNIMIIHELHRKREDRQADLDI